MTWHYLPVYVEHEGSREYSICEVYRDDKGRLTNWTERRAIAASGDTPRELQGDLQHMLNDLARWEPVRFSELAVGMQLQPTGAQTDDTVTVMTRDAHSARTLTEEN